MSSDQPEMHIKTLSQVDRETKRAGEMALQVKYLPPKHGASVLIPSSRLEAQDGSVHCNLALGVRQGWANQPV